MSVLGLVHWRAEGVRLWGECCAGLWIAYPVLWVLGPKWVGIVSAETQDIVHCGLDVITKGGERPVPLLRAPERYYFCSR